MAGTGKRGTEALLQLAGRQSAGGLADAPFAMHPFRLYREARPGIVQTRVSTVEPTSDLIYVDLRFGSDQLVASAGAKFRAKPGDLIWIELEQKNLHLFDATTEQTLESEGRERVPEERASVAAVLA